MAAIDVKFPHLIISQISDTQTYLKTLTKIHLFNPVEVGDILLLLVQINFHVNLK